MSYARRWAPILVALAAAVTLIAGSARLFHGDASAATSATFTVSSGGTHAVGSSFPITVSFSNVTFDANSPKWAGYDLELSYNPLVLNAMTVAPTLCPTSAWSSTSLTPAVVTGCYLPGGSTTTSGVLDTVTFNCLANGTTSLHLPAHHAGSVGSGSGLFDPSANDFSMTLVDSTVICGTGVNGPTPTPSPVASTPTATSTPNFAGRATISVSSGGTHAVNDSFTVTTNLSQVVFGTEHAWGGYDLELDYDPNVLVALGATPTLCPLSNWQMAQQTAVLVTACFNQSITATTGVLETVSLRCTHNGTSSLHLAASPSTQLQAPDAVFFDMTLQDAVVVCGTGINGPTPTYSAPSATATPTVTPTWSAGSATLALTTPTSPQALNLPFLIKTSLSSFTASPQQTAWAGYDITLSYDQSVVVIGYAAPTLCSVNQWGFTVTEPGVEIGCFGLQSTATGVLDTLVAKCVGDGTTAIQFVTDEQYITSKLYDANAVPFNMTLSDGSVTCDHHVDDDGDGCKTTSEPTFGLDAFNSWDFYSVPVPALFAAPNPRLVFKDGVVAVQDAQSVFAYFKAGARVGTAVYQQDLNGNGAMDGVDYDRSVTSPGHSGAPDGIVSASDAQLAFAQFKLNYHC